MKFRIAALMALAAGVALSTPTLSAGSRSPYSGIVVFGTSLSDSGNAFALTGSHSVPPDYGLDGLLVPGAPYARGGHHFTNGPTWIEQLARSLGLAASVRPALASNGAKAMNYAVGGARARPGTTSFDLSTQVQTFLADTGGQAPSDALYVIEMGGNDLRDAINAYLAGDPLAAARIVGAAVASIAENIQVLYTAGARHFLVWLPPNVGLTPAIQGINNDQLEALAMGLTQAFNAGLSGALAQLSGLPGIRITVLDANALLTGIVTNPGAYGLTNVTDACVMPNEPPFFCQAADEYLFWDGIHPTRAGHAITADVALHLLTGR